MTDDLDLPTLDELDLELLPLDDLDLPSAAVLIELDLPALDALTVTSEKEEMQLHLPLDLPSPTGKRVISPTAEVGENANDRTLRPEQLAEFIGQPQVIRPLTVMLKAALGRGEPLEHVVFHGPPGLGKTTLAQLVAIEQKGTLKTVAAPAFQRPGDLAAVLTQLRGGDVLFLDEIHRLPMHIEEVLYSAMEDFALDILTGEGQNAKSIRLALPSFTLVGATTHYGNLSAPLRSRFGAEFGLDFYAADDMVQILIRSASKLGMAVEERAFAAIAQRARGTPRIGNRLLRRVRDFGQAAGVAIVTLDLVTSTMELLGVDSLGLTDQDRKYLTVLILVYGGGPAGLGALAASSGLDARTITEVIEPYLLYQALIQRTRRGRVATTKAMVHLDLQPDGSASPADEEELVTEQLEIDTDKDDLDL
jgi:Holliday junction DNA helicase RuvB